MKLETLTYSIAFLVISVTAFAGTDDTKEAIKHSGKASTHVSGSAAHAIAASGKTTSAIAAVPLAISGTTLRAAGAVSTSAAASLSAAASQPATPLVITDEVISTVPPNKALQTPTKQR